MVRWGLQAGALNRRAAHGEATGNDVYIMDIDIGNGLYAVLKDLRSVSPKIAWHQAIKSINYSGGYGLSPNELIGSIFANSDPGNFTGLHLTLIKKEHYAEFFKYRASNKDVPASWLIDPLDPQSSPFSCPRMGLGSKTADNFSIPPQ